jgi:hypothetical protein
MHEKGELKSSPFFIATSAIALSPARHGSDSVDHQVGWILYAGASVHHRGEQSLITPRQVILLFITFLVGVGITRRPV